MSKLAERIKRAGRSESTHMGFGPAAERHPAATLLCILRLDNEQIRKVKASVSQAADAAIVSGLDGSKVKEAMKSLGDLPVGLSLGGAGQADVTAAREAGVDFVLLDQDASAESVLDEGIGFVLTLGPSSSDTELRALAGLPFDALEVRSGSGSLTLRALTELRRLALLAQTPLLIDVPPDASASRLQALREAGVAGVILDGGEVSKLPALHETVLSLPPRGRRRDERTDAILPFLTAAAGSAEEEPEFE